MQVTVEVNGEEYTRDIEPRVLLVHFLRDHLDLTGTHWGCDTSNCGACVVQLDGRPTKSCTILAAMCEGHKVRTVEALEVDGELDPIQQAFHEEHGLQCGFCTPGMLMTTRALLDENPDPDEAEIREAISGAICRCTGYKNIVNAVRWAVEHEGGAKAGAGNGARATAQPAPKAEPVQPIAAAFAARATVKTEPEAPAAEPETPTETGRIVWQSSKRAK
jgi:carbon-monoxide dehydrogenase small subunit